MNLTKEIITDIVSYVNLADIKEFVINHPELVQEEEQKQTVNIVSSITGVILAKTIKIADFIYVTEEVI